MSKEQMLKFTDIKLNQPEKRATTARSSDFKEIYLSDSLKKTRTIIDITRINILFLITSSIIRFRKINIPTNAMPVLTNINCANK